MSQYPYRISTLDRSSLSSELWCSSIVSDFSNHSDITAPILPATDNTVANQTVNTTTVANIARYLKLT